MNLRLDSAHPRLQPSIFRSENATFLRRNLQRREFRVWKRRRLKTERGFAAPGRVRPVAAFYTFFHDIIPQFPALNTLNLIAPLLGFATGGALYFSRRKRAIKIEDSVIGNWVLVTSPTPFNRFVLLRCPSISFEEAELLEGLNDRLMKEERHFVNWDMGRIPSAETDGLDLEEELLYQRVCIPTQDGGVLSLDWPASLDLTKEQGLDTTILLVPGTAQGSMDKDIKSFVLEALKRGYFPVVMNPRGCAGSPLTTARLFSAADSDDVSTAVKFTNEARPWSTLMGVGWGYGANMLTKYLGEVEERTPLTAVACIDNPFDLEEASFPHPSTLDQKLRDGLVDILRVNKELFQGRSKGFNVRDGLSATSIRDFEKAISMVSFGFSAIEEFYSLSSTRQLIGNLKIPVLFIQSGNGTIPLFSVPRGSISENPFTSLLLCSCSPPSTINKERSAILWSQHLVVEWFAAVELALLKGRHPLLKDVDITINPSKGLANVEHRPPERNISSDNDMWRKYYSSSSHLSYKNESMGHFPNQTQSDFLAGFSMDQIKDMVEESDVKLQNDCQVLFEKGTDLQDKMSKESLDSYGINGQAFQHGSSDHVDLVKEEGENSSDVESSQVLQTAEVVMNMLDVTVPGVLADDQKRKVLTAVGQGETLMKALQEAVPEDVRGKLTSAVSEIVRTQEANLNLKAPKDIHWVPDVTSEAKSNSEEKCRVMSISSENKTKTASNKGKAEEASQDTEERKKEDLPFNSSDDEPPNGPGNKQSDSDKPAVPLSSDPAFVKAGKFEDTGAYLVENNCEGEMLGTGRKVSGEGEQSHETPELFPERSIQAPGQIESASDVGVANHLNKTAKGSDLKGGVAEQQNVNQSNEEVDKKTTEEQRTSKEINDLQKDEEKLPEATGNQSKSISSSEPEAIPSSFVSSEEIKVEKDEKVIQKNGERNEQPINQNLTVKAQESSPQSLVSHGPPHISVSQALDALTGFDDSTQMAVNNVFEVIESMIDHLEKKSNHDTSEKLVENESEIHSPCKDGLERERQNSTANDGLEMSIEVDVVEASGESGMTKFHEKPVENQMNDFKEADGAEVNKNINLSFQDSITRAQGDFRDDHHPVKKLCRRDLVELAFLENNMNKYKPVHSFPVQVIVNPSVQLPCKDNCSSFSKKMTKSLDLDSTADLFLEYFPEEGEWKVLDQLRQTRDSNESVEVGNEARHNMQTQSGIRYEDQIIEPSYVILEDENEFESAEVSETSDDISEKDGTALELDGREGIMCQVKSAVLDILKVEVGRRLGTPAIKSMERDLAHDFELVANAVALSVAQNEIFNSGLESRESIGMILGALQGQHIVEAVSSSVQKTNHLKKILPVGLIVGSVLATLRKDPRVTLHGCSHGELKNQGGSAGNEFHAIEPRSKSSYHHVDDKNQVVDLDDPLGGGIAKVETEPLQNESVMVGAITAALGASALMAHNKPQPKDFSTSIKDNQVSSNLGHDKRSTKQEVDNSEVHGEQSNIVASLAEKALSVAAPVVPTKSDGEVDQDRLVAILADLGQKGGVLRLIGKVALLWGGIRGAMSLTDRLISFLRIAERPLFQRILGFACMVLVLWSPVLVPLIPTLVHNWTAHSSSGIAEYACILGLYASVMILVMLWGKRIRGYEYPLEQYGLDLALSSKLYDFLKGLIGGVVLVLSIHGLNASLGFAQFFLPSFLSSSAEHPLMWLKAVGRIALLVARGIVPATGLAIVEEMLFRSWLPEEVAVDLGYHRAIILSGLVFSVLQRSLSAVPGLILLSLALAGIKERQHGKLLVPIGLRAGILIATFTLQNTGLLHYQANAPFWATGTHPWQPFGGVVGLACSAVLAFLYCPRSPPQGKDFSSKADTSKQAKSD